MRWLVIAALVACVSPPAPVHPAPPISNVTPVVHPAAPLPLTYRVNRVSLASTIHGSGTLAPTTTLDIGWPSAGHITAVNVDVGDVVRKGQDLAVIDGKGHVLAAMDGVVLKRAVDAGMVTTGNATLFTLAAPLDRLVLVAGVDESSVARVAVGMPVVFTVPAFPGALFAAKITRIELALVSGKLPVVIAIDNPQLQLRPGMTAEAAIQVAAHDGVLVAPLAAVDHGTVRVLRDGAPVVVPVALGIDDGKLVEVTSGLADGDEVVIDR